MAKGSNAHFGLGRVASIILAIIPITAWICGMVQCFMRGGTKAIIGGILRIFFFFPIFWIIDLITIIAFKDLTILA